jgi:hypothetical protein
MTDQTKPTTQQDNVFFQKLGGKPGDPPVSLYEEEDLLLTVGNKYMKGLTAVWCLSEEPASADETAFMARLDQTHKEVRASRDVTGFAEELSKALTEVIKWRDDENARCCFFNSLRVMVGVEPEPLPYQE